MKPISTPTINLLILAACGVVVFFGMQWLKSGTTLTEGIKEEGLSKITLMALAKYTNDIDDSYGSLEDLIEKGYLDGGDDIVTRVGESLRCETSAVQYRILTQPTSPGGEEDLTITWWIDRSLCSPKWLIPVDNTPISIEI